MDIKDIAVIVDRRPDRPASRVAVDLAKRLNAHLTGLTIAYDPVVPGYAVTPVPIDFMISARNQALDEAKNAGTAFSNQTHEAGLSAEVRMVEVMSGAGLDDIIHEVRLADLVIIGEDDPEHPEPVRQSVIESVLFNAGAPLLIVPLISGPVVDSSHIVIAWDGSMTAARAVRSAMPFLRAAEKVDIVIVDDGKELPTGQRLTAYLGRHGIAANTRTLPNPHKDVSAVVRQAASESGAGLIVMGAYGHSRLLEWILGGATRGMMKGLTIPVILAH